MGACRQHSGPGAAGCEPQQAAASAGGAPQQAAAQRRAQRTGWPRRGRARTAGCPAFAPGTWPCGRFDARVLKVRKKEIPMNATSASSSGSQRPCRPAAHRSPVLPPTHKPSSLPAHRLKVTTTTAATAPSGGGPAPTHGPSSLPAPGASQARGVGCRAPAVRAACNKHARACCQLLSVLLKPRTWGEDGGAYHRRRHALCQPRRRLRLRRPQRLHPRLAVVGALLRGSSRSSGLSKLGVVRWQQ